MKHHKSSGLNRKNGRASGRLGHFSKTDVRFWQDRLFRETYRSNGRLCETSHWSARIQHEGRRERFPLYTPNKAAAAARARDIYLFLAANGWEAALASEHLLKLEVRRIAFVARPLSAPTVSARVAGAREAFFAAGLEPPKEFCRIGDPRDPAFVKELTAGRRIEGIICANDFTAAQLMHSLAKAKILVPEHIRLVGFDNLKYAELFSVPLTTVSQPLRDMAANAIRAMLNRLADPTLPATTLLSNPSLVIRASCGAFMRR